jgi:hypothetical protein
MKKKNKIRTVKKNELITIRGGKKAKGQMVQEVRDKDAVSLITRTTSVITTDI